MKDEHIEQHGTPAREPVLDTPEKLRACAERMRAATRESVKEDRRAAALSQLWARERVIL